MIVAAAALGGGQEKTQIPSHSFDLSVDRDYSARTERRRQTLDRLNPSAYFLGNDTIAVTYPDGEGASSSDGGDAVQISGHFTRVYPQSPQYKFHALIFDLISGPEKAAHLQWDAIRNAPQFMPMAEGGFVVRVDNRFLVYSRDSKLLHEFNMPYYGNKPLPTGEAFFAEEYAGAVSPTGRSLVICHSLLGRPNGGGTQVAWYDLQTFSQIGQSSELNKTEGCGPLRFRATDETAFSGHFIVHPDARAWQRTDPACVNCNARPSFEKEYGRYVLLDDKHLLDAEDRVIDFDGHTIYVMSHERGVRIDGPTPAARAPRIVYSDGQSIVEKKRRWSIRFHVADWQEKREIAVVKIVQDRWRPVHGGGLQLEPVGVLDTSYALSPDGKKLAVLNINSLSIYDLP